MTSELWTINQTKQLLWATQISRALKEHWPEYLMEASELALFMISACSFTVLLYHPQSPLFDTFQYEVLKRAAMGVAMGATAVAIIFSPIGKRSGAHFNPAVTFTYYRLGKVKFWDAIFYIAAQFIGGGLGVYFASLLLGSALTDSNVNFAVTKPGQYGVVAALIAEVLITFVLMSVVLQVSNSKRYAHWTGVCAGILVATYITFESPVSGMSMNPARSVASALWASSWMSIWIYFVAPTVGMLLAAELFTRTADRNAACAKFHHHNNQRCIFRCDFNRDLTT